MNVSCITRLPRKKKDERVESSLASFSKLDFNEFTPSPCVKELQAGVRTIVLMSGPAHGKNYQGW